MTTSQKVSKKDYLYTYLTGVLMVTLVSTNTRQIGQLHYAGAAIVGFLISVVWATAVRRISVGNKRIAVTYAAGAATGTLLGMLFTRLIYGT